MRTCNIVLTSTSSSGSLFFSPPKGEIKRYPGKEVIPTFKSVEEILWRFGSAFAWYYYLQINIVFFFNFDLWYSCELRYAIE